MAGVKPLTSPPIFLRDFNPLWLTDKALIFFKLHGAPGQPYWYGDGMATAISAQQISSVRLAGGAVAFVASCFGGADAPMVRALLGAGAAAVVTGTGPNYAGKNKLEGADVLGWWWRKSLELGAEAGDALHYARMAAWLKRPALRADIQSFTLAGDPHAKLEQAQYASAS